MSQNPFVVTEEQENEISFAHTETLIRCELEDRKQIHFKKVWKETKDFFSAKIKHIVVNVEEYEKYNSVEVIAELGTDPEKEEIALVQEKLKKLSFSTQKKAGTLPSLTEGNEGILPVGIDVYDVNNHREIIQQVFATRLNTEENIKKLEFQLLALEKYKEVTGFYDQQKNNFEDLLQASKDILPNLNERFVISVLSYYASIAGVKNPVLPYDIPRIPLKKEQLPPLSDSLRKRILVVIEKTPLSEIGTTFIKNIQETVNLEIENRANDIFETEKKYKIGEQEKQLQAKEKSLKKKGVVLNQRELSVKAKEQVLLKSQKEIEKLLQEVLKISGKKYEENIKAIEVINKKVIKEQIEQERLKHDASEVFVEIPPDIKKESQAFRREFQVGFKDKISLILKRVEKYIQQEDESILLNELNNLKIKGISNYSIKKNHLNTEIRADFFFEGAPPFSRHVKKFIQGDNWQIGIQTLVIKELLITDKKIYYDSISDNLLRLLDIYNSFNIIPDIDAYICYPDGRQPSVNRFRNVNTMKKRDLVEVKEPFEKSFEGYVRYLSILSQNIRTLDTFSSWEMKNFISNYGQKEFDNRLKEIENVNELKVLFENMEGEYINLFGDSKNVISWIEAKLNRTLENLKIDEESHIIRFHHKYIKQRNYPTDRRFKVIGADSDGDPTATQVNLKNIDILDIGDVYKQLGKRNVYVCVEQKGKEIILKKDNVNIRIIYDPIKLKIIYDFQNSFIIKNEDQILFKKELITHLNEIIKL